MARIEEIGDSLPMSKRPEPSLQQKVRGGEAQLVGDSLPMSRTPVQSPSANPPSGKIEVVGDRIPMSSAANKGWGSAANMPMSERAVKQSDTVKPRKE